MSHNNNSSVHGDDFQISEGSILGETFRVEALLGQGIFGVVTKCRNTETNEVVAIKVNKNHPEIIKQAKQESKILWRLQNLDPDTCNIVRCNGSFLEQDRLCLSFELLDQSLYSYMEDRRCGLPMTEMRSILQQLATAFCNLKTMGIIHADLKLDNIMIADRRQEPLKVKLIDFGLARPVSHFDSALCTQTIWNRAPEVTLGVPFNEAIDMWSLGLAAVQMATGYPLYPGDVDYDVLRFIVETQGQPADDVLDRGRGTEHYFRPQSNGQQRWRLKTPEEFCNDTGHNFRDIRYMRLRSLDDVEQLMFRGNQRDKQLLVDLIKGLLHLDQDQRLQPQDVLLHPFVTGSLPQSSPAHICVDMTNTAEIKENPEVKDIQPVENAKNDGWLKDQRLQPQDVLLHPSVTGNLPQSSPAHICVDMTNTAERKENPEVKDIQPVENADGWVKYFYRGIAHAFNFGCSYLHGAASSIFSLISRFKVGEPRRGGYPV